MKTKVINGRTFTVQTIAAFDSFALQPLLAPVVGRALGVFLALFGKKDSLADVSLDSILKLAPEDLAGLGSEAGAILGALKPADLKTITRGLLGGALCDGVPLWLVANDDKNFNEVFAGRTRDLWFLLWFAVQENYPDFFGKPAGSDAASPAASPSAPSTTSPGAGPSIA